MIKCVLQIKTYQELANVKSFFSSPSLMGYPQNPEVGLWHGGRDWGIHRTQRLSYSMVAGIDKEVESDNNKMCSGIRSSGCVETIVSFCLCFSICPYRI